MKKIRLNRWLLAAGACVLLASPMGAKRAIKTAVDVMQPDGTTLSVTLVGDERAHIRLTSDGMPVVEGKNGYEYAAMNSEGRLVATGVMAHNVGSRSASEIQALSNISVTTAYDYLSDKESKSTRANSPMRGPGLHSTTFPSKGEQKGLIILVEFSNRKFGDLVGSNYKYTKYSSSSTPVHDYWQDMTNKPGFNGFGGTGSVRDWFLDNSKDTDGNSQFIPQFDVYGPVTLPKTYSYYGSNDSYNEDARPHEMVEEACKLLDSEINFADYDRDGDGMVDNVYVFYAGYGEADGGPADTVWPHSWDLSSAGTEFDLDGVTISHYACSNEVDYTSKRPDGIGTFVHEFSHVMGLPDLYSTVYNSAYTPDAYSVMDYGPYNNGGCTPPNYSTYERYALDWIKPDTYGATGEYSISNLADTNKAYIVNTEKTNEYYLVENRQLTGWDKYIPGHGMLIWHIDFKPSIFDANKVNNTPSHQYVDLIEANGKKDTRYADGHPFPGTNGVTTYSFKSWNNKSTGISFEDIKEQNGIIKKTVINLNDTGINDIENVDNSQPAEYYNLQGMKIENPSKGEILIRKTNSGTQKIIF